MTNAEPKDSLKRRAILGGSFEVIGFGTAQVIRLGGNLLLTRLLAPEAFGLMALVMLVNYGLNMLSDLGFQPALVQHPHGGEERFLNTAWTMQMIRGVFIGLLVLLVAWPMGRLYGEPRLTGLLYIAALGPAIYGLTSTGIYALRRQVRVGPLVVFELGIQIGTLAIMLTLAYTLRTVWALVIGLVLSGILHAAASYLLPAPHHHRLAWDDEAKQAIFKFGRWVLLSSTVSFISRQSDRLMLGKLLGVAQLGVYSIAVMMNDAVAELVTRVTYGVAFPLLSRVREESHERLRHVFLRTHVAISGLALPGLGVLAALGAIIVRLLYDDRYQGAGWIMQALTVRVAMTCILVQFETCLSAMGTPKYAVVQNACRAVWVVVAVPVGYHFWGLKGVVGAIMLCEVPLFFILVPPMVRHRLVRPFYLAVYPALFGSGWVVGRGLASILRLIFPTKLAGF